MFMCNILNMSPSRNVNATYFLLTHIGNLTYTYHYLFHSRCFYKRTYSVTFLLWFHVHPLIHCVFLCKYISTYFFLTHIPTHKWKLNLYLPLPVPFQMLFIKNMAFLPFRSTLKSLGVILGGGLNTKVL